MFENQTMSLRLAEFKKDDSGYYTCVCSQYEGINEGFSQNITIEGKPIIFYFIFSLFTSNARV